MPRSDMPSEPNVRELRPAATLRSGGWFLKRALVGIVLLSIFAVGGSALMHATIEPDPPSATGE